MVNPLKLKKCSDSFPKKFKCSFFSEKVFCSELQKTFFVCSIPISSLRMNIAKKSGNNPTVG